MEKIVLNVSGMSCSHCVNAVTKALLALDGISKVDVDLNDGKVKIEYIETKLTVAEMKSAIEDQGYDVV